MIDGDFYSLGFESYTGDLPTGGSEWIDGYGDGNGDDNNNNRALIQTVDISESIPEKICMCGCATSKAMLSVLRDLSHLDTHNRQKVLSAVWHSVLDELKTINEDDKEQTPEQQPNPIPTQELSKPSTIGHGGNDDIEPLGAIVTDLDKEDFPPHPPSEDPTVIVGLLNEINNTNEEIIGLGEISIMPDKPSKSKRKIPKPLTSEDLSKHVIPVVDTDAVDGITVDGDPVDGITVDEIRDVSEIGDIDESVILPNFVEPKHIDHETVILPANKVLSDKVFNASDVDSNKTHIVQSPLREIKKGYALSNIFNPSIAEITPVGIQVPLVPSLKLK
jgi:hypothetical protein